VLDGLDIKTAEALLRDWHYSPEKFLDKNHTLVLEKKTVQEKFKDSDSNKKELNSQINNLNIKMQELLKDKKIELDRAKIYAPRLEKTREVFNVRTFPFYYYDLKALLKELSIH
jgi:hypothetical protein